MAEYQIYGLNSGGLAVTNHDESCEAGDQAPLLCHLDFDCLMVGWTNTRQSRRTVLEAAAARGSGLGRGHQNRGEGPRCGAGRPPARRCTAWLKGHGIVARWFVERTDASTASSLEEVCTAQRAGLLVVSPYGHRTPREWALGGVTRRTLTHPQRCSPLSH